MNEIKWIKLATDLFNNRKIKQIKKMPEGKTIVLIWIQILCLAGECNNNGLIYFSKDIPYTDEMLATEFDEDIKIIRLALQVFEKFKMLEIVDNILLISNWEKYQNVESLEKIREQNRLRVAKHREKQKELLECNVTSNVTANVTVMENVTDKDIDIRKKKEDKEIDKDIIYIDYSKIIDYLNNLAGTQYKSSSRKTQDLIKARFNEKFTYDDFYKVIDNKCNDWLGTEWEKYIRPETLFGTKFENYLNQVVKPKEKTLKDLDVKPYDIFS